MATAVDAGACTGLDWRDLIRIIVLGIVIVFIVFVILLVLFVFLVLLILLIVLLVVVEFALLWRMFRRFSAVDLGWVCLRLLCGRSRAARADDGTVLVELDRTRKRTGTGRRGMGAARGNVALLDVRVLL